MRTMSEYLADLTVRLYGNVENKYKYVHYDERSKSIDIDTGVCGVYVVDLERCKTAGQCLDWIHQLHVKTWFDAEREKEFIDLLLRLIPSSLWSGA